MLLSRVSILTGEFHERELDITEAQLNAYENFGVLVQDAFPNLSTADREFIVSGITAEEWAAHFGEDL